MQSKRIVVVDNDARVRVALASLLRAAGYAVDCPASAESSPGVNLDPAGGPYSTGSQTSRTRASSAALRAISGPIPAGSPTVMPIRGFTNAQCSMLNAQCSMQWFEDCGSIG